MQESRMRVLAASVPASGALAVAGRADGCPASAGALFQNFESSQ